LSGRRRGKEGGEEEVSGRKGGNEMRGKGCLGREKEGRCEEQAVW
jgi:hypothetical protein